MATAIQLDHTPSRRPARSHRAAKRLSPDAARLLSQVTAILDAPAPFVRKPWNGAKPDTCETCSQQRAAAFSCSVCGYRGAPYVHGCSCDNEAERDWLVEYRTRLESMDANGTDVWTHESGSYSWTRETLIKRLHQKESTCAQLEANGVCLPHVCDDEGRLTGTGEDCFHGLAECPCCGGETYDSELTDPFGRIRKLRSVLAGQGVRQPAGAVSMAPLAERVTALLDGMNTEFYGTDMKECLCSGCQAIRRRRSFTCHACAFHGAPLLFACDCRESRADRIQCCETHLAAIEAGVPLDEVPAAFLKRTLAEMLAKPDRDCAPGKRGKCGHGVGRCPTCGSHASDRRPAADGVALCSIIRELRSTVVMSADSAFEASRSIDVAIETDVDGYTQIRIEAAGLVGSEDDLHAQSGGLAIASVDAARALGYALLRATETGQRCVRRLGDSA